MTTDRTVFAGQRHPDRSQVAPRSRANNSASATNSPLSRWSGKSSTGRRCRDLFKGYMRALGDPPDEPTRALVIAASEAVVLAELARQECLAGMTGLNAELTIRFENTAARALRRLGLNKPVAAPKKSFLEKMAEKEHALRTAEAKAAADAPRTDETGEAAGGAL
jgi:hypothetical protein